MLENVVPSQTIMPLNKEQLQQRISEANKVSGFVSVPEATAQKARAMMIRLGVRPEDNLGSCGIVASREE